MKETKICTINNNIDRDFGLIFQDTNEHCVSQREQVISVVAIVWFFVCLFVLV